MPLYCQHAFESQQGNSLRSSGSGKTNTVVRHVCDLCLKKEVAARQRLVRRALDVRVAAFKTVFIGCGTLFKVEVVLMLQSLNGLTSHRRDNMESAASSSRSNSRSLTPEDHDVQSSRCATPDPEVVESYHKLMNSLLPPLPASAIPSTLQAADDEVDNEIIMESGEKRPMTKAEKQNAKKKRRKERERDMKAEIVSAEREAKEREERAKPVGEFSFLSLCSADGKIIMLSSAFRLFSTDTAKNVSLLPAAEDYPIPL